MSSPRVLFVGHGAERTGPPIHLLRLLRWMAKTGCPRPTVVVARDGELVPEYRRYASVVVGARGAEPLEPVAAALRRVGRPHWADAAGSRWLHERLRRLDRHDLVYVNAASPANVGVLRALPDLEAPVLLHVHELDIGLTRNLGPRDRAYLFGRAATFASVCRAVTTNLVEGHGIDPALITTSPGFVDEIVAPERGPAAGRAGAAVRAELGIGAEAFVVATAALPDWRKAPDLLLRTGWTLGRIRPDIDLHLVWVGGSPDSEDGWRATHEANQLGLGARFHLLPHRSDPGSVLAAADVYASTAREDAFPLACLEAAAAGLPIVCFATGGTPELVGDDGGIVASYPDTDALAAALASLHDDPDRRAAAGLAVQARVAREFVTSVVAPRWWADVVLPVARSSP